MTRIAATVVIVAGVHCAAAAHDGPPYPIVSDAVIGPYRVSVWTDPDTTDDGTPGGQFWVRLDVEGGTALPWETRATVAIRPLDRTGPAVQVAAVPVRGDVTNQFAALLMDHEGRFAVQVTIDGPLGAAMADADVSATYDLRPPTYLIALYLLPFLLVGILWGRLVLRRRSLGRPSPRSEVSGTRGRRDRHAAGKRR